MPDDGAARLAAGRRARSRRSSPAGTAIRSPSSACIAHAGDAALGARVLAGRGQRRRPRRDDRRSASPSSRQLHPDGLLRRAGAEPPQRRSPTACGCTAGDATWEAEDPYRFPPVLGELDVYLMAEGSHRRIFERLGAHPPQRRRRRRRRLRGVGAECAARQRRRRLQPVGRPPPPDAQARRGRRLGALHPRRRDAARSTSTSCSARDGELLPLKADPVGFAQEQPPATGSRVVGLPRHDWGDADWMARRRERQSARGADLDLRGASRLVAAQGRRPLPHL